MGTITDITVKEIMGAIKKQLKVSPHKTVREIMDCARNGKDFKVELNGRNYYVRFVSSN